MAIWQPIGADPRVWVMEYAFNTSDGRANSVLMRVGDRKLVVFSPACGLDEAAFKEVDALGEVVGIVAPNGFHHLGIRSWWERYPRARCFAPESGAKRIAKKQPGLTPLEPIGRANEVAGDGAWIGAPDATSDAVAHVASGSGHVWYFNDIVMNMKALPKNPVFRLLFKWTKSGPGFSVNRLVVKFLSKDKAALKRWLLAELAKHPPAAIVPGHGPAVTDAATAGKLHGMVDAAL